MTKATPATASPFVVAIDTREQRPYSFAGLHCDAKDGGGPLTVRTVVATLPTGDYSIVGHESRIAIERKSLADLYSTLGQGRERFVRELERLNEMDWAAVMVEASWEDVLTGPPRSGLNPKTVFRSVVAWQQRYSRVHWWFAGNRDLAEVATYRILDRWFMEHSCAKADLANSETMR